LKNFHIKKHQRFFGETIENTKVLVHRGKKELRKILLKKGFDDMNKTLKILLILISTTIILTGITYASVKIYEKIKGQATMTLIFTGEIGDTDTNNIWISTFQLAWNEFKENVVGKNIEFEDESSKIANELNKNIFTKEMLSENSYYISVEKTSPELREKLLKDINEKFGIKDNSILNEVNFDTIGNSYTIYSLLVKNFEFITPFDKLEKSKFGNYDELVEYFGINNASDETMANNVEVLFYNRKNDFAVKLNTKQNDEIILYRTDNNSSFDNLYKEIIEKNKVFNGKRNFTKDDELKIPYIKVNTIINYDELCGKFIKGTNGMYIANALQNVKFNLNEKGGNLISESAIKSEYNLENENSRYFYFTDNFIIFLKEKNEENPYFSLRVNDLNVLQSN